MGSLKKILERMAGSPTNVRFSELCKVCDRFFGKARQKGTSHRLYRTPWADDPRIDIQDDRGIAKAYQVKQVLTAIHRLEDEHESEK